MDELNLQGLEDGSKSEQKQARELLTRWECLFACSDLDMERKPLSDIGLS